MNFRHKDRLREHRKDNNSMVILAYKIGTVLMYMSF